MSTFSYSVDRVRVGKLLLLPVEAHVLAERGMEVGHAPPADGLAALRGFAAAMVFNAAIVLLVTGAWELWRPFR